LLTGRRFKNTKGTIVFLEVGREYLDAAFNLKISHADRVEKCSFVVNFMLLWRHYLYTKNRKAADVSLGSISLPAFRDVLISCHNIVGTMAIFRDNHPGQPFDPTMLGSDS
jgi:hypothetical protein